ncbi:MAG: LptA/OstA family protein [Geminicoccaceae bacterium]
MRVARASAAIVAAALAFASSATTAARAQSLQHDTSLPIEITADILEVVQDQRIAIFTGNVDAVQGDMVLSADQLRVHYGDAGDAAPAGPAAPAAPGAGSIRRIEAEGNVFLSSPGETAQGTAGVYDVASNRVTMAGAVVLTREDNVIRGERLEIDLVSGRSQIFAAVPSTEGGTPPQRVRALFVPEDSRSSAGPDNQAAAAEQDGAK